MSIQKLTLAPTHTFSSLFGTVHCPFSPREFAYFAGAYKPLAYDDRAYHAKGLDAPAKYAPSLEVRKGNAKNMGGGSVNF